MVLKFKFILKLTVFISLTFSLVTHFPPTNLMCQNLVLTRCSCLLTSGCDGAPLLPLLYIITNMAFNIAALNLVKTSSAVVASLAVTLSGSLSLSQTQKQVISAGLLVPLYKVLSNWNSVLLCSACFNFHSFPSIAISPRGCKLEPLLPFRECGSSVGSCSVQHSPNNQARLLN